MSYNKCLASHSRVSLLSVHHKEEHRLLARTGVQRKDLCFQLSPLLTRMLWSLHTGPLCRLSLWRCCGMAQMSVWLDCEMPSETRFWCDRLTEGGDLFWGWAVHPKDRGPRLRVQKEKGEGQWNLPFSDFWSPPMWASSCCFCCMPSPPRQTTSSNPSPPRWTVPSNHEPKQTFLKWLLSSWQAR